MFKKTIASKEQVKLKLALTGPAGAGKTFSALQIAFGITGDWSKIALADTENRSALYYAGALTGPWEHIDFPPTMKNGYHPTNWVNLISFVESDPKIEVLILDSISHEWDGKGGALEMNSALGGRFTDWAKVTPLHNAFIDKMRTSKLHIIATARSKTDYVIEQNEKGKSAPRKVGLKSVQREGVDYEFGVMFDIDINHFAETSKDRTGLFANRGPFRISKDTGFELMTWAKEGEIPAIREVKQESPQQPKAPIIFDINNKEHTLKILNKYKEDKSLIPDGMYDKLIEYLHGKELTMTMISKGIAHLSIPVIEPMERS